MGIHLRVIAACAAAALLALPGCSTVGETGQAALYDLGPLPGNGPALPALPPLSVAGVQVPAWLDNSVMVYRLHYANSQQPRPYSLARWAMTPGQLLTQRLKARIAQAGGVALSASDGALEVPVLRIEADDFSQHFESPAQSTAHVALRASVFRGRALVAQRSFAQQVPAPSPDAAGGAAALAKASDAAIADVVAWLHALPLK